MGWLLPDPSRFGVYVLVACVAFPMIHTVALLVKQKPITSGPVIGMVILGFSFPGFMFLALSPVDPGFLTRIADKQELLCMTGVIGMSVCFFELFGIKR